MQSAQTHPSVKVLHSPLSKHLLGSLQNKSVSQSGQMQSSSALQTPSCLQRESNVVVVVDVVVTESQGQRRGTSPDTALFRHVKASVAVALPSPVGSHTHASGVHV